MMNDGRDNTGRITRRKVIKALSAAGGAGVAGCSSSEGPQQPATSTPAGSETVGTSTTNTGAQTTTQSQTAAGTIPGTAGTTVYEGRKGIELGIAPLEGEPGAYVFLRKSNTALPNGTRIKLLTYDSANPDDESRRRKVTIETEQAVDAGNRLFIEIIRDEGEWVGRASRSPGTPTFEGNLRVQQPVLEVTVTTLGDRFEWVLRKSALPNEFTGGTSTPSPTETPTQTTDADTPSNEITYGFENPDLPEWDINTSGDSRLETSATDPFSGQYSGSFKGNPPSPIATTRPFGDGRAAQISRLIFRWWETGESFGGGIGVRNETGEIELFVGTDNPEWTVVDDTGVVVVGSSEDDYTTWMQTNIFFNWRNSTASVQFKNTRTATTESVDAELIAGENAYEIVLLPFSSRPYRNDKGFNNGSCVMKWDNILIDP